MEETGKEYRTEFRQVAEDVYYLKIPFGPVFTGVALIDGAEKILVDSGAKDADVDEILVPALRKRGLTPADIDFLTCTHTHGDHSGGFARLEALGVKKIACFTASKPKLEDPAPYAIRTRTRFPGYSPAPVCTLRPVTVDQVLEDGAMIGGRVRLIHTPGHDDDCVSLFDEKTGTLFTGDSIQGNGTVSQGIGFYKDLPDYRRTLEKLMALPVRRILCGHDYDGIGCRIEGEAAVREALEYCAERVRTYGAFVNTHREEAPAVIAEKLIEKEGCGMPEYLFMALYTVTEHLKEVSMSENVLITGSSHGIGAAAAIAFAEKGYNVGITYHKTPEGAEATAEKCRAFGVRAEVYKADLSVREECVALMDHFLEDFGEIHVLVNNAGGALQIPKGEFEDMPLDYWDSQIALNLSAAAYLSQGAIRNMKKNGIPGRIVNIGSIHGHVSWVKRKMLPYCAAKGGIEMFTRALAVEVAQYGIRVNCIAPGFIMTKLSDRYNEADLEGFRNRIPAGFLGQTEHIVPAILFFADEAASRYIAGQVLTVDGGQSVSGIIECMKESF